LGDVGDSLDIDDTEQGISRLQEKSSDKGSVIAVLHEELEMAKIRASSPHSILISKRAYC
jgi:hypothetical protein